MSNARSYRQCNRCKEMKRSDKMATHKTKSVAQFCNHCYKFVIGQPKI